MVSGRSEKVSEGDGRGIGGGDRALKPRLAATPVADAAAAAAATVK